MKLPVRIFFNFIILFCSLYLSSNASASELAALAQSAMWQKLLLYEADSSSPSGLRSAIHSPEFFLAQDGATNPESELQATIDALLAPAADQPDQHAKCRFPARLIWLQQQLPEKKAQLQQLACPEFSAWSHEKKIESVSLVFANGYLGNPASYYGHIFLKFNDRENAENSRLLDLTLNFGAILDKQDDPVSYIVKGISGGYDGGFSPIEFYFHTATYGEKELRDLWEYRLDLPEAAVRMIVAHAWEVMQKRYVYYFFQRNCAYRVAELLQIVDGIQVIPENRPWLVPQALIQKLADSRFEGKALVADKIYHPSRQSRLYEKYSSLSPEEQALLNRISRQAATLESAELRTLPTERKQAVIDTLIDYYQFNVAKESNAQDKKSPPEYFAALAARLELATGTPDVKVQQSGSPDNGRAPSWIQLGIARTDAGQHSQILRLRPAYYDALDAGSAQVKNGALSMGEIQLEHQQGKLSLRQLDLIAIDSVNPAVTGLPGDRGFGWKLKAGMEQNRLSCRHCLLGRLQGDIGLGRQLGSKWFASVYAGGAVQENSPDYGNAFARLSSTILFRPTSELGLRMSYEWRKPIISGKPSHSIRTLEARQALGKDYDLRFSWERDQRDRLILASGYYW